MKRDTRLMLALDVTSRERALSLAGQLRDYFDAIKIGYPLILSAGLGIVREISATLPVIADLKVADIPNTSRLICDAVLGAGASGVIAQAFPGKDSLLACARSAAAHKADLFVVTEMSHPGAELFMAPLAESMARLAVEAGVAQGWERWVGSQGAVIGMSSFGASAPYRTLYEKFGITVDNILSKVRELL